MHALQGLLSTAAHDGTKCALLEHADQSKHQQSGDGIVVEIDERQQQQQWELCGAASTAASSGSCASMAAAPDPALRAHAQSALLDLLL
jgi:hypothetical protein